MGTNSHLGPSHSPDLIRGVAPQATHSFRPDTTLPSFDDMQFMTPNPNVDYPLRHWPAGAGRFEVTAFEEEFRHALRTLAGTGRVLEVNTSGPMLPELVRWWREEGGRVVTFGSDAHAPADLGHDLEEAVAMVESFGFRPGQHPYDRWTLPG